jgi:hypothetical protein
MKQHILSVLKMSKMDELREAAKEILPLLKVSSDQGEELKPSGETPAQRLRREADEIEAKDKKIERFRAAIRAFEKEQLAPQSGGEAQQPQPKTDARPTAKSVFGNMKTTPKA